MIFDFDGTIVNNLNFIIKLIDQKLKPRGVDIYSYSLEELRQTGVKKFIKKAKISKIELLWMLKDFKKEIRKADDSPLVIGIADVLLELSKKYTLLIYSSNTKNAINAYLKKNNLDHYFGGTFIDDSYFGKEVGLKKIIKNLKTDPGQCVYIGDESRDIEAAQKAGMISIAVTWGFEGDKLLLSINPDYLISTPEDLLKIKI
jgi:phosphoglycolate phosphatase